MNDQSDLLVSCKSMPLLPTRQGALSPYRVRRDTQEQPPLPLHQNSNVIRQLSPQRMPRSSISAITKQFDEMTVTPTERPRLVEKESVLHINTKFSEIIEAKNNAQESIQTTTKESRWVSSVPVVLLEHLVRIYRVLLKCIDENEQTIRLTTIEKEIYQVLFPFSHDRDELLQQAQCIYQERLFTTFEEFNGFQEGHCLARDESIDGSCKQLFKNYLDEFVKKDLGVISGITKSIADKEKEYKQLQRHTASDNIMLLHEMKLGIIKAQIEQLKATRAAEEKKEQELYDTIYAPTEDNPWFHNYKIYFDTVHVGGTLSVEQKIPTSTMEKAKRVCQQYYQFHPKMICASDDFYQKINISFLEGHEDSEISPVGTKYETQCTKEAIKRIIKDLEERLKTWDTYSSVLSNGAQSLIQVSDDHQRKLKELDLYTQYRQRRKNVPDGTYLDIWHVCKSGSLFDIKKYIESTERKEDIHAIQFFTGLTPLHQAVKRQDPEIVRYLIDKQASQFAFSASISKEIPFDYTPLHLAAATCCEKTVSACLQKYAPFSLFDKSVSAKDINMSTVSGTLSENYTALHFILKPKLLFPHSAEQYMPNWHKNAYNVIKLLISKGAMVDAEDCVSSFVFAVDEFMALRKELKEQDKHKHRVACGDTLKQLQTLNVLIELLLQQPFPVASIEQGVQKLIDFFQREKFEESDKQLFQTILSSAYFQMIPGKKFLSSLLRKANNSVLKTMIQKQLPEEMQPKKQSNALWDAVSNSGQKSGENDIVIRGRSGGSLSLPTSPRVLERKQATQHLQQK